MSDEIRDAYEEVPYDTRPQPHTHPAHLAALAARHGIETAAFSRCRVLELGCGNGGNLLAMALQLPGSTFVGVDLVAPPCAVPNVELRALTRRIFEEADPADFRAQIEANLFGVVNVTRAALPVLRGQRSGVFVQFSSIGGRVGGTPGLGAYQTAKFAVEGFSEVLANEVSPFGVKVIIVEPGAFRTDWQGSSMTMHEPGPDYRDALAFMHELRRTTNGSQPGDPARAARIIIDVVESPEPPRRLLLGSDAVVLALASGAERNEEARAWAAVSRRADFSE